MAYPIDGLTGKITSWGTSEDVTQLIGTAMRPVSFTINANGNPWDSTALDATGTAMEKTGGLFDGAFDFEGLWPLSSPVLGDTGLLTLGSSYYNFFTKSWFIDIDFGEYQITPLPAVSGSQRYRPAGRIDWSGGWVSRMSSALYPSLPTAANGAGVSMVAKLKETGAADTSFTGNIVVGGWSKGVTTARNLIEVPFTFQGNGALTMVAGTSGGPAILPAGVINTADWDTDGDGVPDVSVILQTATSRTLTGAAFLRRLKIEVEVDKPIRITGTGRFSDAVTPA